MRSLIRPNKNVIFIFVLAFTFILSTFFTSSIASLIFQPVDYIVAVKEHLSWQKSKANVKQASIRRHLFTCDGYEIFIHYEYTFKGKSYQSTLFSFDYSIDNCWPYGIKAKEQLVSEIKSGDSIPIWINKNDPQKSMVERNYLKSFFVMFSPVSLYLIFCWVITHIILVWSQKYKISALSHHTPPVKKIKAPSNENLALKPSLEEPVTLLVALAILIVFNVVFLPFVAGLLSLFIGTLLSIQGLYNTFYWGIIGLQVIGGGLFLITKKHSLTLRLPKEQIFLGDHIVIELNTKKPMGYKSLQLFLTVTEYAAQGSGKRRHTKYERIYAKKLWEVENESHFSSHSLHIDIPSDIYPSFKTTDASVKWEFVLKSKTYFWQNLPQKFEVIISPAPLESEYEN